MMREPERTETSIPSGPHLLDDLRNTVRDVETFRKLRVDEQTDLHDWRPYGFSRTSVEQLHFSWNMAVRWLQAEPRRQRPSARIALSRSTQALHCPWSCDASAAAAACRSPGWRGAAPCNCPTSADPRGATDGGR